MLLALFALEISRIRGDLLAGQDILAKAAQISDILKQHYCPLFHRLIQLRINERDESSGHPASESDPFNEPWGSHGQMNGDSSARRILDERNRHRYHTYLMPHFSTETTAPTVQQAGNGDPYQPSHLTSFLEDSNWMTDPSSMLAFDLPDISDMTPFENCA